jgi:thiol-disulfide isomerase/thioredoxin
MKKVVLLLVVLALAGGCARQVSEPANDNANIGEKPKSVYPPVNSRIMQAENRNLDGSAIKLEEKKGKVILINLWATWCGPCREEIPHLIELQSKYKDKDFEVIGLDVDPETKEEIEKFAAEMEINYTIGWAHEDLTVEVMRMNQMSGIPQSILINREGQLTGIFRGGGANVINKMKQTVGKIVNE